MELWQIGFVAGPVDARLGPPVLVEVVPAVGFQMAAPLVPLRPRVGAVPDGAVELADAALQFDAPAIGQIAVLARADHPFLAHEDRGQGRVLVRREDRKSTRLNSSP